MNPLRWLVAAGDGLRFGERTLSGEFKLIGLEGAPPLNYLASDRSRGRLYATARSEICAFDLTGRHPSLLFKSPCMGEVACHLCLSPDRDFLFCANYISGNVAVFRIRDDRFEFVQSITGRGVLGNNAKRQDGPHAHYGAFINGNFWCVDLGQDAIFIFPWDGKTLGRELRQIRFPSGTGPRHIVLDSIRNRVYCASELTNELFILTPDTGEIVSAMPVAARGDALSAIRLSPDGKVIGIGVRGSDQIAFIDAETMRLQDKVGGGRCVRDFDFIDDTTVCACFQDSSEVVVFRKESQWRPVLKISVPAPMCVLTEPEI